MLGIGRGEGLTQGLGHGLASLCKKDHTDVCSDDGADVWLFGRFALVIAPKTTLVFIPEMVPVYVDSEALR